MQGLLKKCKKNFELLCNSSLYLYIIITARTLIYKATFSTKIELVTQAYTKIPCVNTEKPMGIQDNFSQSKQGCCKWGTLVDTQKILCVLKGICA